LSGNAEHLRQRVTLATTGFHRVKHRFTGQFPYLSAVIQIIKIMHSYTSPFLARIRELVAADQLGEAIRQLLLLLQNSPLLDEAILQSGRLSDIQRQIRNGTVRHDDATLTKNQIRTGILGLLTEIEAQTLTNVPAENLSPAQAALRQEVDKAVFNLHNEGANIKNQFIGGTFNNPTFN
jgi:hypothetical protein